MPLLSRKFARLKDDKGFILVVVLGMCTVLALLGAGFAAAIRGDLRTTAIALETTKARSIAEAGIALAILDLRNEPKSGPAQRRFPLDGTATGCQFDADGSALIVQIEDEGGKVNLNTPNTRLLAVLFAGLGAAPDVAQALTRERGVSRFASIEDLDQIRGLPPEILSQAKAIVTVHSASVGVDAVMASSTLKAALKAGVDKIGDSGAVQTISGTFGDDVLAEFTSRSTNSHYTVRSMGQLANGTRSVTEAIVKVPETANGEVSLQHWRRGSIRAPNDGLLTAAASGKPC